MKYIVGPFIALFLSSALAIVVPNLSWFILPGGVLISAILGFGLFLQRLPD